MSDYTPLSERTIKAVRKPRTCEWCGEIIAKGEPAQHRSYIWEGDFKSCYSHPECNKAMDDQDEDIMRNGWCPGDFKRGSTEER